MPSQFHTQLVGGGRSTNEARTMLLATHYRHLAPNNPIVSAVGLCIRCVVILARGPALRSLPGLTPAKCSLTLHNTAASPQAVQHTFCRICSAAVFVRFQFINLQFNCMLQLWFIQYFSGYKPSNRYHTI